MAQYTRYEKLQKYYKDGTPYEPAEYKKGKNLGVAEYSSIEECQNSSTPPTPLAHQDEIELPTAMREGGTGTWTIVN